jgi:hypothetical protein
MTVLALRRARDAHATKQPAACVRSVPQCPASLSQSAVGAGLARRCRGGPASVTRVLQLCINCVTMLVGVRWRTCCSGALAAATSAPQRSRASAQTRRAPCARQANWRMVKDAVRGYPDGQDVAAEDVQAMAALVPAVVLLRDRHHLPQCAPPRAGGVGRVGLGRCVTAPVLLSAPRELVGHGRLGNQACV